MPLNIITRPLSDVIEYVKKRLDEPNSENPSEEKLNMITSASPPVLALKLSISKETGLRPVELCNLRVRDIDLNKGIIYPNTAKGGSARKLKITSLLPLTMLRLT